MTYIDVHWRHQEASEPVRLVSELDANRYEVRKLEFFLDGRVGFAPSETPGRTELGEVPVPELYAINHDSQFRAIEITAPEFERLWGNRRDAP